MNYQELYEDLQVEYENLQDQYCDLDKECNNLSCELEDLKQKIGDFHINESPLGWAVMGSSTHERRFLSKEKGWNKEMIEDVKRILED